MEFTTVSCNDFGAKYEGITNVEIMPDFRLRIEMSDGAQVHIYDKYKIKAVPTGAIITFGKMKQQLHVLSKG